jgi:hypothetical protein
LLSTFNLYRLYALEEERKHAARLLPPPLYVLYTQLAAAKEAFSDDFGVSVEGSVADAESLVRKAEEEALRGAAAATTAAGVANGGGGEEGDEEEGGGGRAAKRARVSENAAAAEVYTSHPLTVLLVLSGGVSFTFRYGWHLSPRYFAVKTHSIDDTQYDPCTQSSGTRECEPYFQVPRHPAHRHR